MPEPDCIVELSSTGMSCTHPDGTRESVDWNELQRVEIMTTEDGPFLSDVFWILHGANGGCVVPQGAAGESELLSRLQRLPGFRNDAVIEALGQTTNHLLVCWERSDAANHGRPDQPAVD